MNTEYTRKVLEAALLAAGRTLSLAELAQLFEEVDRPDNEQLRIALAELGESWGDRAFELRETAMGFRVQVRREYAEQVARLWPERPPRYSRAMLETLAIVAYRQPLTRGEIEGVRGVAVNPNIVRTLSERNWIRVVGHREVPGRPELLGTTRDFLDYFGLKSLDQLPSLAEIKSLEELDPQLALPEPVGVALPAPETVGESTNDEGTEQPAQDADAQSGEESGSQPDGGQSAQPAPAEEPGEGGPESAVQPDDAGEAVAQSEGEDIEAAAQSDGQPDGAEVGGSEPAEPGPAEPEPAVEEPGAEEIEPVGEAEPAESGPAEPEPESTDPEREGTPG